MLQGLVPRAALPVSLESPSVPECLHRSRRDDWLSGAHSYPVTKPEPKVLRLGVLHLSLNHKTI